MQNTITETETLITSEQNRCSIDIGKNPSPFDNSQALFTSNFVGNAVSLSYGRKNLDKYILVRDLENNLIKIFKSDKSFTDFIKNTYNLGATLKFSNALTNSRQNTSYESLPTTSFYPPTVGEMMGWNVPSNTMTKEIFLSTHIANRNRLQEMEMRMQRSQDSKNNVSKNEFVKLSSIPALDFVNGNSTNESRKLNLLYVFANEADYEETSSDFYKIRYDEDIRMILPTTWNIRVASNSLTLFTENKQHVTIVFRNPFTANMDHKYSNNLSLRKKCRFYSSTDVTNTWKSRAQNNQMRKLNPPKKSTFANQVAEPFNWRNDKAICKSPKQVDKKKISNNSFLLLREPILLNWIEQNKTKQVLMYKPHSVQNESENNFSKTLEELLDKSVRYNDEPIHLVFEPLKLITRLKRKEKNRGSNVENYYKCKHDLTESPIYKKLLLYQNTQLLKGTQHKKRKFRTLHPKNENGIQRKDVTEISGASTNTTDSCLDLPKNFSSSVMMKKIDMNRCTMQEVHTSEISTTPVIATHSCFDLAKNFSASFSRKNFDLENKTKSRCRRNTTALKHLNVKKVVSSVFKDFFHFYSLLGGNLRSGTVITRLSSNYWLQVAGVATDFYTLRLAGDLFTNVAGRKVVLNIFDYIKFLVVFARTRGLIITDLVKQMMVCEELSKLVFSKEKCKKCTRVKNQESELTEIYYEGNHLRVSQSLPNVWPPKENFDVENRSCLKSRNDSTHV